MVMFIVCTRRHDARFFLKHIPTHARTPAQKNIAAGTCVDTCVTSAACTEFYLCSHIAFQGTAKAVKYTVLEDTIGMKAEEIQALTWMLSHGHQVRRTLARATRHILSDYHANGEQAVYLHVCLDSRTARPFVVHGVSCTHGPCGHTH
jgi:hypothetical protein